MTERILVLTTSYPTGPSDPAGHFVAAEVLTQRRAGQQVEVIAAGGPGEASPGVWHLGAGALFSVPGALERLKERPLRALSLILAAVRLWRMARRMGRYDRVDAHWLIPSAWPAALLFPARTRIAIAHGSDVRLLARLPARVRNGILDSLRQRGFSLRFVSHALRDELLAAPGFHPAVRRFIAQARIAPAALALGEVLTRPAARHKYGLDPQARILAVVGRLVPGKRVSVALAAATAVPRAEVHVLGDGPLRHELAAQFRDVRFWGQLPRQDVLDFLAACDLVVHASQLEGAPSIVREARLLGIPVVAVRSGDLSLWAQEDPELWVVEPGPSGSFGGGPAAS